MIECANFSIGNNRRYAPLKYNERHYFMVKYVFNKKLSWILSKKNLILF